jgi:hypothetical protein
MVSRYTSVTSPRLLRTDIIELGGLTSLSSAKLKGKRNRNGNERHRPLRRR